MQSSVRVLSNYLADTFYLYLKTHNFHWNVTGPLFFSLHKMFEEQYNDLFTTLDEVAEKIRTFNVPVPGTTIELQELTCITEHTKEVPTARDMIKFLFEDHEKVIENLKFWIDEVAEDVDTQDYLIERLQIHEKTAWMLRSSF